MEEQQIQQLRNKDPKEIHKILEDFNKKNADLFNLSKFHENGQWISLWGAVFSILADEKLTNLHCLCLNTVRILTRDEHSLHANDINDDLNCLITLAKLNLNEVSITETPETPEHENVSTIEVDRIMSIIVEALKCLCNLVYQSPDCRRQCVKNNTIDAIIKRVASATEHPCALELYDMKLLFLITAFEPAARSRLQIDLNGIAYITEWLDEKLCNNIQKDDQLDVLCEMLKVMFNITTSPDKSPNENEIQSLHLTSVLRQLLLRFSEMKTDRERCVVAHAINLLTNMSSSCLTELMVKCDSNLTQNNQILLFEGWNVRALNVLLRFLQTSLEEQENSAGSNEQIPPVLTVLIKCVRCHPIMRHYVRSVILPPLRDVSQRPEVGHELRNYLCRFLTLPSMIISDLSAELLFICCKENVGRMIKYTGYGNSAGLFANRGLLDCRRVETTDYSSDSENSDTEEYKKIQHAINPVLGAYEPPQKNPLEGMSDEQKEYDAMQLVQLMDKLHKSGIVQPCRIDEDGKPQPVDHILQLQEELPQQQYEQKRKT